jgi:hypothetical protein
VVLRYRLQRMEQNLESAHTSAALKGTTA